MADVYYYLSILEYFYHLYHRIQQFHLNTQSHLVNLTSYAKHGTDDSLLNELNVKFF